MGKRIVLVASMGMVLAGCQTAGTNSALYPTSSPSAAAPTPSLSVTLPTPLPSPSPTVVQPTPTLPSPTPVESPTPVTERNGVLLLGVPFGSQAPYANWDDLHNEACEEAAMIMADAFFNDKDLTPHLMEQAILSLVKWETENNYTVDVTAAEVVRILNDYFQLSSRLVVNPTAQSLRDELIAGRIVIIPAAGRKLGNPNFRRPGPLYHMLVVRGYDANTDEFITNDPGTRKGEQYRYKATVLISAIHDWPKLGKTKDDVSEAEMNAGNPVVIVVSGE